MTKVLLDSQAEVHDVVNDSLIVLATLNARYIHASFGLRYLKANLGELKDQCSLQEFTIDARPIDVVEMLLARQPKIIGFGVYVWNVRETERVIALLNAVAHDVMIVLGGPEVSYEQESQTIIKLADYVISGWGEISFAALCQQLLHEQVLPENRLITGVQPKLADLTMPYALYDDEDIKNRLVYVEASRGCPFKCEFCLSALDKTAWPFDLDAFLNEMDVLHQRGARHFKFVDRTFNLKIKNSLRILDFFLARMDEQLFLHFEVVPDHLPDSLKDSIKRFPAGSLQFEIGIQTFNPEVQSRISRRQDNIAAANNVRWIREHSHAHIHADLIFGLPGETLASFADSFDQLYALQPHEIQVGILKRLKGSPIIRHTDEFKLVFNPEPPFNILSNSEVDFKTVQRIGRFARFWDMIANSGRFKETLPLILSEQPFLRFLALSDAIFAAAHQTHKIALRRLFDLVFDAAQSLNVDVNDLRTALLADYVSTGQKSVPDCLRDEAHLQKIPAKPKIDSRGSKNTGLSSRQARHA